MADSDTADPDQPLYEDLAHLESKFDDVDVDIFRKHTIALAPLYAQREEILSKIPNFWALVFEQAPPDIDQYIQPTDSEIFGNHLLRLEVEHFELPLGPDKINKEPDGHPRSILIKLEFSENPWFEDKVLEKKFWRRRASDGWTGLVSEPVRIHWKKGKDLTHGLMDGAIKLWEARKKSNDMQKKDLPAYKALHKLLDTWTGANTSFFTWFAFVSSHRWVSAEESNAASAAEAERRAKYEAGDKKFGTRQLNPDNDDQSVEVFDGGAELAEDISGELWQSAIRYFVQAQEADGLSDEDFEDGVVDLDGLDDDDDDEMDEGQERVDIDALLKDPETYRDLQPPAKKQKK